MNSNESTFKRNKSFRFLSKFNSKNAASSTNNNSNDVDLVKNEDKLSTASTSILSKTRSNLKNLKHNLLDKLSRNKTIDDQSKPNECLIDNNKTNDSIDNSSMRIRKGRLSKSEKIQDKMRRSISEEITNESIRPRFSRLSFKKQQKVSFQ
jgi:hypothetical protein